METLKACKDCRHASAKGLTVRSCHAPQAKQKAMVFDEVEGYTSKTEGSILCHTSRVYENLCGKKAKWFEQKQPSWLKRFGMFLLKGVKPWKK